MALPFADASHAADLRPETVSAWEQYTQEKDAAVKLFAEAPWVTDDNRLDCTILESGKILVAPAEPNIPKRVPAGLIHDWIGTAFIPNATISQVLAAVRDYDRYKDVYHPAVIDSKLVSSGDDQDRFSLLLMNKAVIMKKADSRLRISTGYLRPDFPVSRLRSKRARCAIRTGIPFSRQAGQ